MEKLKVQAADILPGPMMDATFCGTEEELFAVVISPFPEVAVQQSTIRVYDLFKLKDSKNLEFGDQSLTELPLRWEGSDGDLYQSVTAVDGKLLFAGLNWVMELDAEAGPVTSGISNELVWPERIEFPEPIFPPLVHKGMVVVLSHNGSVYTFPRLTPPRNTSEDKLTPIYAVGGWSLPKIKPAPVPYETAADLFKSQGSVKQAGTIVGDRLMFQHDDHIVVVDLLSNGKADNLSLASVQCNGAAFDLLNAPIGAALRPEQHILDWNGYGFLPLEVPQEWRLNNDKVLQNILLPLMLENDHRNGPQVYADAFFHLISGVLIAPDGTLELPLCAPSETDMPWIYPLVLRSAPFRKDPAGQERHGGKPPLIEALQVGEPDEPVFLFRRVAPNQSDQGIGGLPQGRGRIYQGPWEEEAYWAYLSLDDGAVRLGSRRADLDEKLHASPPFWTFDPSTGTYAQIQIVATPGTLTEDVIATCQTPALRPRETYEDETALLVRGKTGRTMAFNSAKFRSISDEHSRNRLLFLPD